MAALLTGMPIANLLEHANQRSPRKRPYLGVARKILLEPQRDRYTHSKAVIGHMMHRSFCRHKTELSQCLVKRTPLNATDNKKFRGPSEVMPGFRRRSSLGSNIQRRTMGDVPRAFALDYSDEMKFNLHHNSLGNFLRILGCA